MQLNRLCNKLIYVINQNFVLANDLLWFGIYDSYAFVEYAIKRIHMYINFVIST